MRAITRVKNEVKLDLLSLAKKLKRVASKKNQYSQARNWKKILATEKNQSQ